MVFTCGYVWLRVVTLRGVYVWQVDIYIVNVNWHKKWYIFGVSVRFFYNQKQWRNLFVSITSKFFKVGEQCFVTVCSQVFVHVFNFCLLTWVNRWVNDCWVNWVVSLAIMLPVPSPGKGGGSVDRISTEKLIIAHRSMNLPQNRTDSGMTMRWPCEEKLNDLEEEKCSAI